MIASQVQQLFDEFENQIIEALGLESMSVELRKQVLELQREVFEDRMAARLADLLSESEEDQLEKMTENQDIQGVRRLFQTRNIDIRAIFLQELRNSIQETTAKISDANAEYQRQARVQYVMDTRSEAKTSAKRQVRRSTRIKKLVSIVVGVISAAVTFFGIMILRTMVQS